MSPTLSFSWVSFTVLPSVIGQRKQTDVYHVSLVEEDIEIEALRKNKQSSGTWWIDGKEQTYIKLITLEKYCVPTCFFPPIM